MPFAHMPRHLTLLILRTLSLFLQSIHYSSQMVFQEITSKDAFLDYFRVKLEAIGESKATVFTEMGKMRRR